MAEIIKVIIRDAPLHVFPTDPISILSKMPKIGPDSDPKIGALLVIMHSEFQFTFVQSNKNQPIFRSGGQKTESFRSCFRFLSNNSFHALFEPKMLSQKETKNIPEMTYFYNKNRFFVNTVLLYLNSFLHHFSVKATKNFKEKKKRCKVLMSYNINNNCRTATATRKEPVKNESKNFFYYVLH